MPAFVTIGTKKYVRDILPDTKVEIMDLLLTCSPLCIGGESLTRSKRYYNETELLHKESWMSAFYVLCNGRKVESSCIVEDGKSYHFVPRLLGGKGGFGSMLRAIGAQIEKTTSREACRDLSGRRMRDINNEKKLKEWLAKEADREREKEERKQERLAKASRPSQHKFEDTQYHEQKSKVQEDLEDALQKGLRKSKKSSEPLDAGPSKKAKMASSKELLGMDIDSDDLESDSDHEANPGSPEGSYKTPDAHPSSSPSSNSPQNVSASKNDDQSSFKEEPDRNSDLKNPPQNENSSNTSVGDIKVEPEVKEETIDSNVPIALEDYGRSSELAALGLERLKNALMVLGLKCGGTLEERAERLFSVKGLTPDQIDPSLFAKSKGKGKKSK